MLRRYSDANSGYSKAYDLLDTSTNTWTSGVLPSNGPWRAHITPQGMDASTLPTLSMKTTACNLPIPSTRILG